VWDNPYDTNNPLTEPASLKNGLVAYYPFNGNANDESGNGNNGTVNGATLTTDRFGSTNKAYLFDGVNDFVQVSSSQFLNMSSGQDFTVTFFVDIKNISSKPIEGLVSKMFPTSGSLGANNGWQIGLTNTTVRVQSRAGSSSNAFNNTACASDIIDNVSGSNNYHFAFAFDRKNGELRFFKNSLPVSSLFCSELNGNFSNNYPLLIGVDREKAYHFNGVIDEIRIYNRVLSQEEITYLANN
jgi:hypothetical protein